MTSTPLSTTLHPTSFASLPREIRDESYGLVLFKDRWIHLPCRSQLLDTYGITSTKASSSVFALEARAFYLQHNRCFAYATHLPRILGPDRITFFDTKRWVRSLSVSIESTFVPSELVAQVECLLECSALREVEVVVHWDHKVDRRIGFMANAFEVLGAKLGGGLIFMVTEPYYVWYGDLEELRKEMKLRKVWE